MKQIHESKYLIYDKPRRINIFFFLRQLIAVPQNALYKVIYQLHSMCFKGQERDKKYYSCVCAIFKNEAKYLVEWIEYNRIVGIDHIYLYDNKSTDNYLDVLKPYIEQKYVELVEWPYDQGQISAYEDCIKKRRYDSKWIGFIDIDEFIVPIHHNCIKDFLKSFERAPAVKIYWKMFCTSGYVNRQDDSLVTESFHVCWRKHYEIGKCFYNTSYDPSERHILSHHNFWSRWGGVELPPVNCFGQISNRGMEHVPSNDFPIQINHYFTKSFNEYLEKAERGDVLYKDNPHDIEYFFKHEMLSGSTDYSICKYLIKLKLDMNYPQDND